MKTRIVLAALSLLTGCTTTVIDMPKDGGTGGSDSGVDTDSGTGGMDSGHPDTGVACSIYNCAGCCFNNACQAGTATTACGIFGVVCAYCPGVATTAICKADQTCGVDPEGVWKVQPTSATIATTNQGADWDFGGGAPDPYALLWCPSSSVSATNSTPTAADTFNPTWSSGGCLMKAKDLMNVGYAIQAFDEDVSVNDSICGKGTIVPSELELFAGSMTLKALPNLITMNVALVKQ